MWWVDLLFVLSAATTVILGIFVVIPMTTSASDRYVVMRITLMKIARGEGPANVLAQNALDTVEHIDVAQIEAHIAKEPAQ